MTPARGYDDPNLSFGDGFWETGSLELTHEDRLPPVLVACPPSGGADAANR